MQERYGVFTSYVSYTDSKQRVIRSYPLLQAQHVHVQSITNKTNEIYLVLRRDDCTMVEIYRYSAVMYYPYLVP
jgi:hypothetical protein